MAHVEPTGLPVESIAPALRDALCDVSADLADAQHTAHGTLADVSYAGCVMVIEVTVNLGRPVPAADARRVTLDLGDLGAPVLVRGLTRTTEGK